MHEEIDFVQILNFIYGGLKTFVMTMLVSLVLANVVYTMLPKQYKVSFDLKPMNTFDAEAYTSFNALNVEPIDTARLYQLFLERVALLEDIITTVDATKIAKDPINMDDVKKQIRAQYTFVKPGDNNKNWPALVYQGDDPATATHVLQTALKKSNEYIRQNQKTIFANRMAIKARQNTYALEDINRDMAHAKVDYERSTHDRLAFLKEQAQIAHALNVAQNTMSTQSFKTGSNDHTMVATLSGDHPYYLYGYKGIEKEIDLMSKRADKQAFIQGLVDLEHKKRAIESDATFNRAQDIFKLLPLAQADLFKAANLDFSYMETTSLSPQRWLISLKAVMFGLVLGVLIHFIVINRHHFSQS